MEKERLKVIPLTSEREIAADNGMWLAYPTHLGWVLDCQKSIKHKVCVLSRDIWTFKISYILWLAPSY